MDDEITGIVLEKTLRGESGVILKIFSRKQGIVALYKRVSAKKTTELPDYFDEVCIQTTRAKTGDMLFVADFEIQKKRTSLASDYEAFACASKIALCCVKNGKFLESFENLYDDTISALEALLDGANAHIVYLKFMYLFARREGYAIKEDFFQKLEANERADFKNILLSPAKSSAPRIQNTPQLLEKMLLWISQNTDISIGA